MHHGKDTNRTNTTATILIKHVLRLQSELNPV